MFAGHLGAGLLLKRADGKVGLGTLFLGALLASFEASTVLVLRAHYFMDVFTGAVVALLIARCFDDEHN